MRYGIPWGHWSIREEDWDFIKGIIQEQKIKTVLEFGTGLSTLLTSELAEIDTFETNGEWAETIKAKAMNGNIKFYIWNGQDSPEIEKRYDLAFVDGPVRKIGRGVGREMSTKLAAKYADRIILHDAGDAEVARLQERILSNKFQFISQSDKHRTRCNYWKRR